MKWCFCFSILIVFHLQYCYSTYVFTQYDLGTHVCKSEDYYSYCPQGTDAIFIGDKKNMPMNLGFLNLPSDKFYDDYNMTEYGFPIFYKYDWTDEKLNVDLIIANGKQASDKQGYVFSLMTMHSC
uniref:Uncharacterized protein n=1 Tax=Panagrolaimus davidi TaxID=227884 RepID=A0A914QBL8_9BILA